MNPKKLNELQEQAAQLREELDRLTSEVNSAIDELHNKLVDFAELLEAL